MNIKFCISSHLKYYENTYPVIIPSLIEAGIPEDDIYFFIGGSDVYSKLESKSLVHSYTSPHNSLDFTGLISVLELDIKADYWFLLHDTCYVGPNFYNHILNTIHNTDTVSLSTGTSMNMGSYKWSYLISIKDKILTYKNPNEADIQAYKHHLVVNENIFLTNEIYYNTMPYQSLGVQKFYNGVDRIVEYFPNIDLFKIKANWQGYQSNYNITL